MAKNKEPEFTVTDRRKFTTEGELRPDLTDEQREQATQAAVHEAPVAKTAESTETPQAAPSTPPPEQAAPPAPSREEQERQHGEYRQSAENVESELRRGYGAESVPDYEATVDRLLEPFYLTALMQLGMMPAERGTPPQVDIIGARHTIDTLALLQEKTKGNLTPDEANVMETVLYQLRMRYVELTNAIARSAQNPGGGAGGPVEPGGRGGPGGPIKL